MKKIISLLVSIIIIVNMSAVIALAKNASHFTDVSATDYYTNAADTLYEAGIISGYDNNTFGAKRNVTRAEMATFICRILGQEDEAKAKTGTTTELTKDVDRSHWASGYVYVAVSEKIISGYGNGLFLPENNVTFEEAVKMLVCASGLENKVQKDQTDWAKGYIDVAKQQGFTNNITCKRGEYVNRGDVAVMLYQSVKNKLHKLSFEHNVSRVEIQNKEEITKSYFEGDVVSLNAIPRNGYKFVKWSFTGGGYLADANSPTTEFVIGKSDAVLSPICEKINQNYREETVNVNQTTNQNTTNQNTQQNINQNSNQKYHLEVTMTGCGAYRVTSGNYYPGDNVPLYVLPEAEEKFIEWLSTSGEIHSPNSPQTIITMPNEDVTVLAVFENGNPSIINKYNTNNNNYNDNYSTPVDNYYEEETPSIEISINDEIRFIQMEDEVIRLVNEEREKYGLGKLHKDDALALRYAAVDHTMDMHERNFFSHVNPDGESMEDRVNRYTTNYRALGENIAKGQRTPEEVVNAWMNSPGHRANILSENYQYIGVSVIEYNGTYIWTQCFMGR